MQLLQSLNKPSQQKYGDTVRIRLPNNNEVESKITNIKHESDDEYLIVLKVTKEISDLINYRKISLDIIWFSYSGFKVPNQAIVEEDGIKYVVRNRAGYLSKIPVKIGSRNDKYATNDKYSIIENYDVDELRKELNYTDKQINSHKNISLYDEVILNPDLTKIE